MLENFNHEEKDGGEGQKFEHYLKESLRAVKNNANDIGKRRRLRHRKQRQMLGDLSQSKEVNYYESIGSMEIELIKS